MNYKKENDIIKIYMNLDVENEEFVPNNNILPDIKTTEEKYVEVEMIAEEGEKVKVLKKIDVEKIIDPNIYLEVNLNDMENPFINTKTWNDKIEAFVKNALEEVKNGKM